MQLIFDAYTTGEYKDSRGDIAIDEIVVRTDGDCQLESGEPSSVQTCMFMISLHICRREQLLASIHTRSTPLS